MSSAQVDGSTGLIFGAAAPRSTKGLLPDNGAGGLVIDVKIARAESQVAASFGHGCAVFGKHGTREGMGVR